MSDDPRLFDAFDACLARLAAGEALDACLRSYPDLSGELQPMLAAALEGMAASCVPHPVQIRSRARFLGAAATLRPETQRANWFGDWFRRGLSTAITLTVGFLLGTTGLYYASASTLPGDSLYGVKRAFENTRIQLAADPRQRFSLEQSYEERRTAELQAVLTEDRAVAVSFGGVLMGRTETVWQIGGFNVQLTDQTEIVGQPQPGFYVAVLAEIRDGALIALRLEAEETEIIGVLERSGTGWSIGGTSFVLGSDAVISGEVAPGMLAAARIRALHTGERVAVSLVTISPSPSPTPSRITSPSPPARPTQTVRPALTRLPTLTPPPAAPSQPPPTQQPAIATASRDDDGNANANRGGDNSGSGSGDDNSGSSSGGGGHSGSGGGGDNSGSGSGGDNSGSGGGGDNSGSGGGGDNSGSGGGGDNSGSGGGDD